MEKPNSENTIEVCFSPALAEFIQTSGETIVVVADILRATTTIVSAIANGARSVIPVAAIEKAMELKKNGFPVAAERNGKILSFADYGNSAFDFINGEVKDQKLVFTTTNGTVAILTAKKHGVVAAGAFSNLSALAGWIAGQNKNIIILCSGWKNTFCLEDSIYAGALIEKLLSLKDYQINCDSAHASLDLWKIAKDDLLNYIQKALHRERLRILGVDNVLEFSFTADTCNVVPLLNDGEFVDSLQTNHSSGQ
jgi:2-phosphosulfolactate phosphatase